MKLVIEIPEEAYKELKNGSDIEIEYVDHFTVKDTWASEIIRQGTPLPEGHRIGDLDALIYAMKERNEDNGGEPLNAFDRGYDLAYQHLVTEVDDCVIITVD